MFVRNRAQQSRSIPDKSGHRDRQRRGCRVCCGAAAVEPDKGRHFAALRRKTRRRNRRENRYQANVVKKALSKKIVVKSTRTILFKKSSILSRVEHLMATPCSRSDRAGRSPPSPPRNTQGNGSACCAVSAVDVVSGICRAQGLGINP